MFPQKPSKSFYNKSNTRRNVGEMAKIKLLFFVILIFIALTNSQQELSYILDVL